MQHNTIQASLGHAQNLGVWCALLFRGLQRDLKEARGEQAVQGSLACGSMIQKTHSRYSARGAERCCAPVQLSLYLRLACLDHLLQTMCVLLSFLIGKVMQLITFLIFDF
jgi:hypothetical protein